MITGSDVLLTVAQVGLGLAGFGSLVSTFVDPADGWKQFDVVRFRSLIGLSLATLFFALLPFVFFGLGFSESASWRAGSAIAAFTTFVVVAAASNSNWGFFVKGGSRLSLLFTVVLGVAIFLCHLFNAAAVGFKGDFGGYFAGLFLTCVIAANYFVRMIYTVGPKFSGEDS
jgi:hypothetical protein